MYLFKKLLMSSLKPIVSIEKKTMAEIVNIEVTLYKNSLNIFDI